MQHFLVAPDKFKGTLSAREVSECMAGAIADVYPNASIVKLPFADGGDGSLEILLDYGFRPIKVKAHNALLQPTETMYGLLEESEKKVAFIEMAQICGIASLDQSNLRPKIASSLGLGEVTNQVLNSGIDEIIISVGGSASTDGGIGFLIGLGAKVRNGSGDEVSPNLAGLSEAATIDLSSLNPRVNSRDNFCKITFLVDVTNPLTGQNGAAYIFGPQKGLSKDELPSADASLVRWADLLKTSTGNDVSAIPGSGAAGGVTSAALAICKPNLMPGAEWFSHFLNLEEKISQADFVLTGEGSFDAQSLLGKGPGYVVKQSLSKNKKVGIVAGRIEPNLPGIENIPSFSLSDIAGEPTLALHEPRKWLREATHALLKSLDPQRQNT